MRRFVFRPRSLCSRGCTLTGASAEMRKWGSPRMNGGASPSLGKKKCRTRNRTAERSSAASTIDRRQKSGVRSRKTGCMKWVRYGRYTPEDLDLSSEDLLKALANFL